MMQTWRTQNTERRMKRFTLSTIPLLCAAIAPLCADAQGNDNMTDAQRQQKYMDEMNKITPSGEPAVTRWADPFVSADFIWWKTMEDGLDYAYTGTSGAVGVDAHKGKLKHPRFKYEPGFKVGAGLKFRHDGWDTFVQYTRLNFNRQHSGSSDVQTAIGVPFGGDTLTWQAEHASGKWSLNFNVIDWELGRNFWVSKWLTMRPFVGLKFDWTNQKFKVEYKEISSDDILIDGSDVAIKMHENQWAAGLRAGLNTTWYMARHWCIYGELALSGMVNSFNTSRKDDFETPAGLEWVQNNFKGKVNNVTPVIEWSLGLGYETAFHNDDYMFQFRAGWEEQVWFNQNQFSYLPTGGRNTDLTFQGLTVKAAFYF